MTGSVQGMVLWQTRTSCLRRAIAARTTARSLQPAGCGPGLRRDCQRDIRTLYLMRAVVAPAMCLLGDGCVVTWGGCCILDIRALHRRGPCCSGRRAQPTQTLIALTLCSVLPGCCVVMAGPHWRGHCTPESLPAPTYACQPAERRSTMLPACVNTLSERTVDLDMLNNVRCGEGPVLYRWNMHCCRVCQINHDQINANVWRLASYGLHVCFIVVCT
jgi:hypothetical protein